MSRRSSGSRPSSSRPRSRRAPRRTRSTASATRSTRRTQRTCRTTSGERINCCTPSLPTSPNITRSRPGTRRRSRGASSCVRRSPRGTRATTRRTSCPSPSRATRAWMTSSLGRSPISGLSSAGRASSPVAPPHGSLRCRVSSSRVSCATSPSAPTLSNWSGSCQASSTGRARTRSTLSRRCSAKRRRAHSRWRSRNRAGSRSSGRARTRRKRTRPSSRSVPRSPPLVSSTYKR